jgi:hypothetical protein
MARNDCLLEHLQLKKFLTLRRDQEWIRWVKCQKKQVWTPGSLVYLDLDQYQPVVFLGNRLTMEEKRLYCEKTQTLHPSMIQQRMWLIIYQERFTFALEALLRKVEEEQNEFSTIE